MSTKDQYIDNVATKLRSVRSLLERGPVPENMGAPLRDEQGLAFTFSNILDIARNFYDQNKGKDTVSEFLTNFSDAGYGDVADIRTLGAIDVTIMAAANSLIPFVAIDRAMNNPADIIYFNDLVAVDSHGDISEGDDVYGNFTPPNNDVELGPYTQTVTGTGSGSELELSFGENLVPGTIELTLNISGTDYTGKDFSQDGTIYFSGVDETAEVNYQTGTVTISNVANDDTASCKALVDVSKDTDGSSTLKVKNHWTDMHLETHPKNIIYNQDAHTQMYMGRILSNAASVGGLNYGNLHFKRLTDIYIEDVNRGLLKSIISSASTGGSTSLDLSSYSVQSSMAQTKNDLVHRFFINMRTDFLSRTSIAPSVCICGSKGSAELQNHPTKFVPAPDFYQVLNGFIGTFDGMPVYRHNYIDNIEDANSAEFYMVSKLPDNSSGTVAWGEFLPLTSTGMVGNFQNPQQQAVGYFSQVGEKVISGKLIQKGTISYA